jgi:hypothetical protein
MRGDDGQSRGYWMISDVYHLSPLRFRPRVRRSTLLHRLEPEMDSRRTLRSMEHPALPVQVVRRSESTALKVVATPDTPLKTNVPRHAGYMPGSVRYYRDSMDSDRSAFSGGSLSEGDSSFRAISELCSFGLCTITLCVHVGFFTGRWFFKSDFLPKIMIVSNRSLWSCVRGFACSTSSSATA